MAAPAAFRIEPDEAGATLAAVVRRRLGVAWSRARTLCARGKVSVDGAVETDAARRVAAGAEVRIDERAAPPPPAVAVTLVYEDAQVVVIDKPAGVSSVPYEARERGTAMDLIRDAWRRAGRRATTTPLHVVHRIDKETSGLLVFAKTKPAERALQALFRAHAVERTYLCVAHGRVADARIESHLVPDRGDGLRGSARRPGQGKRAVTHVRALRPLAGATLCEVRLETGKTHQIRIHLAERGHPLVGEKVYIRDFVARGGVPLAAPRLLLHAATLGFAHPESGTRLAFSSPLPDDFSAALDLLSDRR